MRFSLLLSLRHPGLSEQGHCPEKCVWVWVSLSIYWVAFGKKDQKHWLSPLLGGLICFVLSATAFWLLLSDEELEGGIPFLPDHINTTIGLIFIALGGLFTLLLGVYAFYEFYKLIKKAG